MVAGDLVNTAARIQSAAAARDGAGRRGDAARDRGGDRLRGGRRARAEGQDGAAAAAPRAPRARGPRRRAEDGRPRAAVRGPRPRAAPGQGALPRSAEEGKAQLVTVVGTAGHRQVAPRLGVREVRRRARRPLLLAPRPLPRLRRRRRVLGARRDGAHAGGHPRGGGRRARARQAPRVDRGARRRRGGASLARAAARAPARPGRADRARPARTSSRRGGSSSSGLPSSGPVVLVFEDLHWADAGLLDFIEYLLEWSRSHAIFVLALARPDLLERRPTFGAGGRNATTLSLEPLSERAMGELLDGFVPGLPDELRGQILGRAEGVPLYAVETVRMLLDRGLLARRGRLLPADGRDRGARRARDAARARRRAARRPRPRRSGGCSRTPPSSASRS